MKKKIHATNIDRADGHGIQVVSFKGFALNMSCGVHKGVVKAIIAIGDVCEEIARVTSRTFVSAPM